MRSLPKNEELDALIAAALKGGKRPISRLITAVESGAADSVTRKLAGRLGHARVIGITGPPGAGKSTLTSAITAALRERGERVGVVAIDPTSPFTGGAILGDRIRMDAEPDEGVFFRSMGTRGAYGGLSSATRGAVNVLDACGFDVVIIETVGVGQSEVEIVNHADLVMVLAVPGLGDDIQAIKAGLLEIGDMFVINKCDLPGADRVSVELRAGMSLSADEVQIPIKMVSAETKQGLGELLETIDEVFGQLSESGEILLRRALRLTGGARAGLRLNKGGSNKMKCLHIDHIGIAVKNLEEAAKLYEDILGLERTGIEEVEEQKVKVMFIPNGDCEFELLESTSDDGPVAKFIEKNGEGVQHIAIKVEDIDVALAELKEKGVRLIDETPRYGAGNKRIAFVHPKATKGILLELCQSI